MITKALVEELVSPTAVRVRIPIIDRLTNSDMGIQNNNLNIATICSLPNCHLNLQVGDVVFVGFEDHSSERPIILGQLITSKTSTTYPDLTIGSLVIQGGITIGNITTKEISALAGVSDNIQNQLNLLNDRLSSLEKKI